MTNKDDAFTGIAPHTQTVSSGARNLRNAAVQVTQPAENVPGERIKITPQMRAELEAMRAALGNPGAGRIMKAVEKFEADNRLDPIDTLTEDKVRSLVSSDGVKSFDAECWRRLMGALSIMKAEKRQTLNESVAISDALHKKLVAKIEAKGGLSGAGIMTHMQELARASHWPDTGLNADLINEVVRRKVDTISHPQLKQLQDTLEAMPDRARRRALTKQERQELEALYIRKGRPGTFAIWHAARDYAKQQGKPAHELQTNMVEYIISDSQQTYREDYYALVKGGLKTMKDSAVPVRYKPSLRFPRSIKNKEGSAQAERPGRDKKPVTARNHSMS